MKAATCGWAGGLKARALHINMSPVRQHFENSCLQNFEKLLVISWVPEGTLPINFGVMSGVRVYMPLQRFVKLKACTHECAHFVEISVGS